MWAHRVPPLLFPTEQAQALEQAPSSLRGKLEAAEWFFQTPQARRVRRPHPVHCQPMHPASLQEHRLSPFLSLLKLPGAPVVFHASHNHKLLAYV